MRNYSQTISSQQDRDVNQAGKAVGYDLLYLVFNPKTETAKLNFTAVTSGGFVYGVATASSSPVIHGTVTGGTGPSRERRGRSWPGTSTCPARGRRSRSGTTRKRLNQAKPRSVRHRDLEFKRS